MSEFRRRLSAHAILTPQGLLRGGILSFDERGTLVDIAVPGMGAIDGCCDVEFFSGILLLLCSLWILFQPLVFGTTAVIVWVGISLLFAGVAACSLSLQLHRAHRCLGDR